MSSVASERPLARNEAEWTRLRVSETFTSFQGEGPSSGQRAAFLRLGLCNLDCSWCDTPYTWDRRRHDLDSELRWVSAADAWQETLSTGAGLLVITGGEPLIQQGALAPVVDAAGQAGWRVEIETNATIRPSENLIRPFVTFNASVKLSGSGVTASRRIKPAVIQYLAAAGRAVWKSGTPTASGSSRTQKSLPSSACSSKAGPGRMLRGLTGCSGRRWAGCGATGCCCRG